MSTPRYLPDRAVCATNIQSKLVLLTLTFPRVRIIWSCSPYATAEIFRDLKVNSPEPDPAKAVTVGAEEDPDAGAGVNAVAEELLRTLPGITAKNVKHVMSKVESVRALCELSLPQVQEYFSQALGVAEDCIPSYVSLPVAHRATVLSPHTAPNTRSH